MDIIRFITDGSAVNHDTAAGLVKLLHQCQRFSRFFDKRSIQHYAGNAVLLRIPQIMNRICRERHIVKAVLECPQCSIAGESLDNHAFPKWHLFCQ